MSPCPPTCTRHAALGHQDGPCGPLTLADIQAVAAAAEEARGQAAGPWPSRDLVMPLARAVEALCAELLAARERIARAESWAGAATETSCEDTANLLRLRRAAEAVDRAYEDADHVPPCIVSLGRVLAGREP